MKKVLIVTLALTCLVLAATGDVAAVERGIILIDRTGSMTVTRATGNTRCDDARLYGQSDVTLFFNTYPTGLLAVWTFANETYTDLTGYTNQATALAAVTNLPLGGCDGVTPLAEAMCDASNSLAATGAGTKVLFVSSDGGENYSDGLCAGPFDADGSPPWDIGSWQDRVIGSFVGNAIVNCRYWGYVAKAQTEGVIDPETGKSNAMAPLADADFFQDLTSQTGGQYQFFDDNGPASVPTLSKWGLIVFVVFLLVAGTVFIVRRRARDAAV